MSSNEKRRWLISGRVQGVFFRESTRREAELLDLSGHAVNLPDGRVEVVAHGSREALDQLESWLRSGPPAARVNSVELTEPDQDLEPGSGFRTG